MELRALMVALKTKDVKVVIMDNDEPIIKFYSDGYLGIESEVLDRTVKSFDITSATSMTIYLEPAV